MVDLTAGYCWMHGYRLDLGRFHGFIAMAAMVPLFISGFVASIYITYLKDGTCVFQHGLYMDMRGPCVVRSFSWCTGHSVG